MAAKYLALAYLEKYLIYKSQTTFTMQSLWVLIRLAPFGLIY